MVKLTDQLREAIDASGMSRYRVCQEIGVDQSTISRFMAGKAGLALDTVDRLGQFLGLKLVTVKQSRKSKGR